MGFFDKLLGRNWQKLVDKGDRYREQEELGLALQEYRAAQSRFDGTEDEAQGLAERISEVRKSLRQVQIERARTLLDAGQAERAASAIESAMGHCETDE